MALEIPAELEFIFQKYGIPWPDVDEDVFHELPGPLRSFGESLTAVGDAIECALQDLAASNPSRTLQAIHTYFQAIRRDFMDRITDLCDDLAGAPCETAYDMVVAAKCAAIAALAYEVENDVVDIVSAVVTIGADSAIAAAEAIALREAISQSLQIAEAEIVGSLLTMANGYLDNFVNSVVQPFINSVASGLENTVQSYTANVVFRQVVEADQSALLLEEAVSSRLHLSPSELETGIQSVWNSSNNVGTAARTLEGVIEELFSRPAPNAPHVRSLSSDMRMALRGVVLTVKNDLVVAAEQLISHVEQHFVTILQDYKQALDELDQQGRAVVSQQHISSGPNVVALSVIGVGTAVSEAVVVTSGVVNAEEAEAVQVETASAVDGTASIAMRSGTTFVAPEEASTQVSVEEVALRSRPTSVTAVPVTAAPNVVENLKVKASAEVPHVTLVQDGAAPTRAIGPHRSADRVAPVQDSVTLAHRATSVGLAFTASRGRSAAVSGSDGSAQGVSDARTDKLADKELDVDNAKDLPETHDR